MSGRTAWTAVIALFAAAWIFCAPGFAEEEAPRIAKEEVKALLNDPNVALLDARITPDWKKSDKKIKGAVRVDPLDVGAWTGNYPKDKKIIVYCA
jgi:rhodanese-related sulfurtransferase